MSIIGPFTPKASLPVVAALLLFCGGLACERGGTAATEGAPPTSAPQPQEGAMPTETLTFALTSPAFKDGETIPEKYTGDGEDVSPPLEWADPPEGTQSYALVADDPDAPRGTWVHWVAYRIPGAWRELKEGIPAEKETSDGIRQGENDFNNIGYGGPAPPPGKPHRYYFSLYALDFMPDLEAGLSKEELLRAVEGHVLAQGQLMGKYGR